MDLIREDKNNVIEFDEIFDLVKDKTEYLDLLLKRILDDSSLAAGQIKLHRGRVNFTDLLKTRISSLIKMKEVEHSKFELDIADDVFADVDEIRMTQVVDNLIGNAIKYSQSNSNIRIGLGSSGRFTIQNAIDEEKVSTAKKSNNVDLSAGLGLGIVQFILKHHDARLILKSDKGIFEASFALK